MQQNTALPDRYVTLNEAATDLKLSRDSVRRLIRSGDLNPTKIGRSIRVEIASLQALGKPMHISRGTSIAHH